MTVVIVVSDCWACFESLQEMTAEVVEVVMLLLGVVVVIAVAVAELLVVNMVARMVRRSLGYTPWP
jgi:hypothetical protein